MPITFTFHTIAEKKHQNGESIVWLRSGSSFDLGTFEPREIDVEYQWTLLDSEGYDTGQACVYEGPDDIKHFDPPSSARLDILFDSYIADESWLWMSHEEFFKTINEYEAANG